MGKKKKSRSSKSKKVEMSDNTKKALIVLASSVLVIGGAIWAYYTFTALPPPDLAKSSGEEVVDFLGSSRGLARMRVPQRFDYLIRTASHYSKGPQRDRFARRIRQMSSGQKQIMLDATFDIAHTEFMAQAKEFNKIRNKKQRTKFVDNAIRKFGNLQSGLIGTGPGTDLGSPFRSELPKSTDEWTKVLLNRTSAHDRAVAKPYFEAVIARNEQKANKQARR